MRLRLALLCSSLATVHPLTLPGAPPASKPAYALHDAAQAGDASAVSLLLLSGLPPEERNAKESTALHLAVCIHSKMTIVVHEVSLHRGSLRRLKAGLITC